MHCPSEKAAEIISQFFARNYIAMGNFWKKSDLKISRNRIRNWTNENVCWIRNYGKVPFCAFVYLISMGVCVFVRDFQEIMVNLGWFVWNRKSVICIDPDRAWAELFALLLLWCFDSKIFLILFFIKNRSYFNFNNI